MEQSKFYQIKNITEQEYTLVGCDGSVITRPIQDVDKSASAFTIQDANDGDVLVASDGSIFLFAGVVDCACKHYVALTADGVVEFNEGLEHFWETSTAVHPATKEQRDLLFSKMKEAGYEWDAKKKELQKIGQEKDMNNKLTDFKYSLKHIMEEAIECGDTRNLKADADMLLRLVQKPTWSEEDERKLQLLIAMCDETKGDSLTYSTMYREMEELKTWLKSLKDRYTWKPSNEQVNALWDSIKHNLHLHPVLKSLYQDLKKLREK